MLCVLCLLHFCVIKDDDDDDKYHAERESVGASGAR